MAVRPAAGLPGAGAGPRQRPRQGGPLARGLRGISKAIGEGSRYHHRTRSAQLIQKGLTDP
eukprot:14536297-Heterocapsa_arctica.AAC.1